MITRGASSSSFYVQNLIEDNFRNFVINGDFRINQRSFTSSTTTGTFNYDRWFQTNSDGTVTVTANTHTVGAPPKEGLDSPNFVKIAISGQTLISATAFISQRIEDVRSLAGDMVTVSFWAKAASGTPKIGIELTQEFGTGGSADVNTSLGNATITTSWARYSRTVFNPSISGKTVGANSALRLNLWLSSGSTNDARAGVIGIQNNTFDVWGVQVERGLYVSNFELTSIADELSLCQRYYYRLRANTNGSRFGVGMSNSTTAAQCITTFPTSMRIPPLSLEQTGTAADYTLTVGTGNVACSSVPTFLTSTIDSATSLFNVATGLVANGATLIRPVSIGVFLGWSAEI